MNMEIEKRLITPPNEKPLMIVYAGTNGAGKSHFTEIVQHQNPNVEIFDADALAKKLNPLDPAKANMEAGRQTIKNVYEAIEQGRSFSIESTLGGTNAIRQMNAAREQGFHVRLYYIGLDSAEHHIERVAQRVAQGGHHISDEDIRRRYQSSLDNLPKAMRLADDTYVFDNTKVFTIKLEVQQGLIQYRDPQTPHWVERIIKSWENEQKHFLQDLKNDKDRLSEHLREASDALQTAKKQLVPLNELKSLVRQRDQYAAQLEEMKPKGIIQKVFNPNAKSIELVESTINRIDQQMAKLQKQIPPQAEIPLIQGQIGMLRGIISAVNNALQRVSQQILAIQNERQIHQMQSQRQQTRTYVHSQSQELEL
ncbi:zeta toxin family protein [Neobacillus pocheonensis]|uniref:zeta toxin family protein n=1 Tax=Neobacillus pocheonensis TaxID=363869 RepID=UPI003D2D3F90